MGATTRFFVLAALLISTAATPVAAELTTVRCQDGIRIEPCAYSGGLGVIGNSFTSAMLNNHYVMNTRVTTTLSTTPTLTIPAFGDLCYQGFGHWWANSHGGVDAGQPAGNTGLYVIETYSTSDPGRTARDNAFASYLRIPGIDVGQIFRFDGANYLGIGVRNAFISSRYYDWGSMVFWAGCSSYQFNNAWPGRASFIGYPTGCYNTVVKAESDTLYGRMQGTKGYNYRPLSLAHTSDMTFVRSGGDSLELAPTVRSTSILPGTTYYEAFNATLTFSQRMNDLDDVNQVLTSTGPVYFKTIAWSPDRTRLDFRVSGRTFGTGTIKVIAYNPAAGIYTGARSDAGGIGLDGNSLSPNGDAFTIANLTSKMEDNPWSVVDWFKAIRQSDGVHLSWMTAAEYRSQSFIVQRGTSADGQFTMVGELPAQGDGLYELVDPEFSDGLYRLLEVETVGDTAIRASMVAVDPWPETPPSPPVNVDSLWNELAKHEQVNQPAIPLPTQYLIFTPEVWRDTVQVYADWCQSRGLSTQVVTIESLSGWTGIKPYIQGCWGFGPYLRYVLLVGDANWTTCRTDPAWWDPVMGWYPPPPSIEPQPQFNRLPTYYLADPDPAGQSMSRVAPCIASDGLYTDVDGDSLADIPIGRWPVRSGVEVLLLANKSKYYADHLGPMRVGLWNYDISNGFNDGPYVRLLTDSLATFMPPSLAVRKLYASTVTPNTLDGYRLAAIGELNLGLGVIVGMGTEAGMGDFVKFLNTHYGFDWSQPAANDQLSFIVGASCNTGNFDYDDSGNRPVLEAGLLAQRRGPVMVWAPDRGTWQFGDYLVVRKLFEQAYAYGTPSAAGAAMYAAKNIAREYPQYKLLAQSYNFLGDPTLPMVGQQVVVDATSSLLPARLAFSRPWPNPSLGQTSLSFSLPRSAPVQLDIFNPAGRKVRTLVNELLPAGSHVRVWNSLDDHGTRVTSGVYFVQLTAGNEVQHAKLVIISR